MGLGVLEPKDGHHVAGTVMLDQSVGTTSEGLPADDGLRRGTGRNAHIVLVPQPSDDPEDPLNWPVARKWTFMIVILLGTAFIYVLPVGASIP